MRNLICRARGFIFQSRRQKDRWLCLASSAKWQAWWWVSWSDSCRQGERGGNSLPAEDVVGKEVDVHIVNLKLCLLDWSHSSCEAVAVLWSNEKWVYYCGLSSNASSSFPSQAARSLAEVGEKAWQVEVLKQGSRQSFSDIRASPWSLPASLCQLVLQPAPWGERVSDSERNMFFSPTIWKMCCLHSQQNLFFPLLMGHMPLSEPVFVADLYSAS